MGAARRLRALFVKEGRQVVRDPSSILIAFVLPAVLLFLFGFGVSLDAEDVRLGVVVEQSTPDAQDFVSGFAHSRFFEVRTARDRRAFLDDLRAGRLHGIVVVPADFAAARGHASRIQVLTDGSEPNTAAFTENYVRGVWANWIARARIDAMAPEARPIRAEPRVWFNAELESRRFLVPGSIAIIMTAIGVLLTALVVAREWERGTMEALLSTPVRVGELIAGKIAPYFVLGLGSMLFSVMAAVWLFDVPLRGSFAALLAVSAAFLLAALGQGLLISTVARNQLVAAQLAVITGFLPSFLLSGFIFEIDSMPWPIRLLTTVIPARYLVSSLQTVFLAGDVWALYLVDIGAMLAIAAVFFALIARKTKRTLQ